MAQTGGGGGRPRRGAGAGARYPSARIVFLDASAVVRAPGRARQPGEAGGREKTRREPGHPRPRPVPRSPLNISKATPPSAPQPASGATMEAQWVAWMCIRATKLVSQGPRCRTSCQVLA
jgi:hypothetical protein